MPSASTTYQVRSISLALGEYVDTRVTFDLKSRSLVAKLKDPAQAGLKRVLDGLKPQQ